MLGFDLGSLGAAWGELLTDTFVIGLCAAEGADGLHLSFLSSTSHIQSSSVRNHWCHYPCIVCPMVGSLWIILVMSLHEPKFSAPIMVHGIPSDSLTWQKEKQIVDDLP